MARIKGFLVVDVALLWEDGHAGSRTVGGGRVAVSGRLLLILSCSQRKRLDLGLLPAIERYDGGHFRVLRKARREGYWPEAMDVLILSARYGPLAASTPITNYDQKITRDRANELHSQVLQVLQTCARQNIPTARYTWIQVEITKLR